MTCGKLFTALGLVMLLAAAASAGPLVTGGLVLYFDFEGMTTAAGGVVDGSNNHANGTIVRDVKSDIGMRGASANFGYEVLNAFDPLDIDGQGTDWVDPVLPQDPYNYDPWPENNAVGTNHDYNYIWMQPSELTTSSATPIPTMGFTEAAWVKAKDSGLDEAIFNPCGYNNPAYVREFFMHLEIRAGADDYRTTLRTALGADIVNVRPTLTPGPLGTTITPSYDDWTHIAWTYDAGDPFGSPQRDASVKFYVDGVLKADYNTTNNGIPTQWGASLVTNWDWGARIACNVDNSRQFVGSMDDLYIFNRTLSASEIATLANFTGPETPLLGDANLDGTVDDEDASILGANWQASFTIAPTDTWTWCKGDFNLDGAVNDKDSAIMAAHWGETGSGAEVPEPSTVALLLGAVAALLVWRRRG